MTDLHSLAERPAWRRRKGPRGSRRATAELSCVHRGEQLRTVPCTSCSGTVRLKVFACALHGACLIRGKPTGSDQPRDCLGCPDRMRPEA